MKWGQMKLRRRPPTQFHLTPFHLTPPRSGRPPHLLDEHDVELTGPIAGLDL